MKRLICLLCLTGLFMYGGVGFCNGAQAAADAGEIQKVRMTWEGVPNAVMYEVIVTDGESRQLKNIVKRVKDIYTLGYELDTRGMKVKEGNLYWTVRAMDVYQRPLTSFSKPKPLLNEEINPNKPLITGEYDQLPFAKAYPVYSWIPVDKANAYEIQIFKSCGNNPRATGILMKTYQVPEQRSSNYYDDDAYVREGAYWWRVRAKDKLGMPVGQWSDRQYFTVKKEGVKIAALGDSITHGGGAITVPPSYMMYDWETYTGLPVLNLGYSGDTVEKMVNRFKQDVVYFSPQILIIMGGVNNIRLNDNADFVINKLDQLKFNCSRNNIVPVFVTVTPVNPKIMREVSCIPVADGWMGEQQKVNAWIKKQAFHVDVTEELTASNGYLKESLSADGLHPDADGKKIIGEKIGDYIRGKFPDAIK